ncbi:MAG: nitroreductase family protein [Deltaproteobacteria bacterium]
METIKAIMTRRSIRKFKSTPVPENTIKTILESAMNAPSAGDGRPWHFIVIDDRSKLDLIAEKVDGNNELFKNAPLAILILGDEKKQGFPGFYPQDCSCACQNIYLSAHDLGLGSVWIALWSVEPRIKGLREVIEFPIELVPFAIFPIGIPDEELPAEYRYDPGLVHFNKW